MLEEVLTSFTCAFWDRSLAVMHVIDAVLDSFSDLFRSHRYHPLEKLYSISLQGSVTCSKKHRLLTFKLALSGVMSEAG